MPSRFDDLKVANGDLVLANQMPDALTAAGLRFEDGATQVFTPDGKTTYVEQGRAFGTAAWWVLLSGAGLSVVTAEILLVQQRGPRLGTSPP